MTPPRLPFKVVRFALVGACFALFGVTSGHADTIDYIHDIQGNSSAVTGAGPFTVEAIVVGDSQGQGSGQLRGFFIQEEDADADFDPATSEGLFVFCGDCAVPV